MGEYMGPQRQTPQRHSTTTPNATTPPPLFRLRCTRQTPAGASDAYVLCVQATQKKKNLPSNSSWCERRVRSLRASNAKKKNSMEDPTTPVPLHHPCVYNFVGVI